MITTTQIQTIVKSSLQIKRNKIKCKKIVVILKFNDENVNDVLSFII
jgi:hypothetical protein